MEESLEEALDFFVWLDGEKSRFSSLPCVKTEDRYGSIGVTTYK